MLNETQACTIIKNSFIEQGHYLFKIPDPSGNFAMTIQRDFDMIGRYLDRPVYMEVKYLNGLKSFNLSLIKEHQINSLLEYKKISNSLCLIALGVNVARNDKRLYIWDLNFIYTRYLSKENILKKELESTPYYTIKKNRIIERIVL
jgi:penicillin-binding protein-related factor A (putative recombinase)